MGPKFRRIIIGAATFIIMCSAAVLGAGDMLSAPAHRVIGPPPADLHAEVVSFPCASGTRISGWLVRGKPGGGAVLLLHGVRSDRRQMVGRARFLRAEGYSILIIDLPGHGESGGDRISFGYREAEGVGAAVRFMRHTLPGERIGVIGVSMGAASVVLSSESPPPDAVVLESMYPTIEEAVADRLKIRLGAQGNILAPLLLDQLPLWLDISADQLRPIDHLSSLDAPVLIAAGTDDRRTTEAETERLFKAASQPKELWLVKGATHVDLYDFNPKAYEARVSPFLSQYLHDSVRSRPQPL